MTLKLRGQEVSRDQSRISRPCRRGETEFPKFPNPENLLNPWLVGLSSRAHTREILPYFPIPQTNKGTFAPILGTRGKLHCQPEIDALVKRVVQPGRSLGSIASTSRNMIRPALSGHMDWWRMEWPFSRATKVLFRGRNSQEIPWISAESDFCRVSGSEALTFQRRRNDDKNNFWEVESKGGSAGGSKRGSTADPPWNFIVGLKHRQTSILESRMFFAFSQEIQWQ